MSRLSYNAYVLQKTLDLLRHDDPHGLIEALINSCYLAEQALKKNIHDKNPLLYYDQRSIRNPRHRAIVASGEEAPEKAFSVKFNEAIQLYLVLSRNNKHERLLEDLRIARNDVMHSIKEITISSSAAGDISAKLIIELKPLLKEVCGLEKKDIDVVTYAELRKRQKELEKKASDELSREVAKHHAIYKSLGIQEIRRRLEKEPHFNEEDIFVSSTEAESCPSCSEKSLDEITAVDFDWNPDGIISSATTWYQCRVCELTLSAYDYETL